MNFPESYSDPVSQMQMQAYGSSTREVHECKCKHSEINACAIILCILHPKILDFITYR